MEGEQGEKNSCGEEDEKTNCSTLLCFSSSNNLKATVLLRSVAKSARGIDAYDAAGGMSVNL